jgi:3-phosphoshikimate 1-carboxyvinyltransferase
MPLPNLIEIVPLGKPVRAEITVPGSKSITNRALILAALADGEVTLEGALWSEDTQVMVEALRKLGFEIKVEPDPDEFCNRRITVKGLGGKIPNAGTPEKPLGLFVGNAGTAARFLAALVCLGNGVYRLSGVPRMHERPQAALFKALRELGYRVDSANDKLPAVIHGQAGRDAFHRVPNSSRQDGDAVERVPTERSCTVSIEESSQFASALLLCAEAGGWQVKVSGDDAEEAPYVAMTQRLMEVFPKHGGAFQIEPDASSGSYFWGAGWLLLTAAQAGGNDSFTGIRRFETDFISRMTDRRQLLSLMLRHWPKSGWQIDAEFPDFLPLPDLISREGQLGDSIMMAIVLAADATAAEGRSPEAPGEGRLLLQFTELGRLRLQECERVAALRTELTKCGARVVEKGDTLTVFPAKLHGAAIETYNDHRLAMCFAILGLKVPGIKIHNPACVKKTFPNFFQKLAAPPPGGLGATIRDGRTGRKLEVNELFAQ